ncbi:MAG TPA: aminopeptidase P family protein [Candidatus Pygmaiobacter gallistercoris]|nr:aminopeptidase P family protein [Candidatus Pygmaiobacter gallistercoris]
MENRCQKLARSMPDGFEAALVTTVANRFYFLDFDADDAGTLVVFPDESVFLIDSRYIEVAGRQVKNARVEEEHDCLAQLKELLQRHGVHRLYVEDAVSVAYARRLQDALDGVELDLSPTLSNAIRALRVIKEPEEIERMRNAQKLTDACFTHICGKIRPGAREIDLALEMETFMRSRGADGMAFPIICIGGPNTSMPHGVPGERKIQEGDFVTMDYGARWGGYCSDMTRTVAVGAVSAEMEKVYNTVLAAQLACCKAIRPGMTGAEVDAIAREIIYSAGYEGKFGHGLGHSVGIEIHEDPRCSPRDNTVLRPGMTMTIEPGIYLPEQFGVRIEDMVVLTEDGAEIFGNSDKNLILL